MEMLSIADPDTLQKENKQQLVDFAAFVRNGGEAKALHINSAKCLVQLRSDKLIGTAALKTDKSYRNTCFERAGLTELADKFPFELGYVVVHPPLRGRGLSYLVVAAALSWREKSGVYATSNLVNLAMHRVLESRGFIRAGVPWESELSPGQYLALFLSVGTAAGV
jgi:GNAT superfamily N-acetyltransferase